ncbi:MAG: hypothetical protein U9N63_01690 [Pseudomonadota bacterium]|nr:hypothetical protein [Pseudomonadota bacterium]
MKSLKVGPYKDLGKITLGDVIKKYWPILLLTLILFIVMAFSIAIFIRLNRSIRATQ